MDKFTFEITSAIRAVGEIKKFQVAETILILFNIPIAYLFFKAGYPPYFIYVVTIIVGAFAVLIRFYYGKKVAHMNIIGFIKEGILPILFPIIIAVVISYFSSLFLP